jgi:putative tryptophan/tyrosine transport system substrate-binding protein
LSIESMGLSSGKGWNEAPRVHPSRWRGCRAAAGCARSAAERVRRIVFLHALAENDPEVQTRVAAFRQGLETLGWTETRNIQIGHRFFGGDFAQIQAYTAELVVSSAPDLIVCSSTPVLAALKQATRTNPIVFNVVIDPVGQGLIASLARPWNHS